jgi:hypothetical protein
LAIDILGFVAYLLRTIGLNSSYKYKNILVV